jgi:hypothetical protein
LSETAFELIKIILEGLRAVVINLTAKAAATSVEAEAIEFARDWLRRHSGNPWSDHPTRTADASRAFWRHVLWRAARQHPVYRLRVIAMARAGDADADEVIRTLIIEMQSRGDPMPAELVAFTMEVLHGGLHQPPGPKRKDRILRDVTIAMAVAAVIDRFGFNPYRNTTSGRLSACAVVAAADNRSEKAVETIWRKLGRAMPTVAGWSGRHESSTVDLS